MPASRSVTRAVSAVLDLAPRRGEVSLTRLVDAVSEDRQVDGDCSEPARVCRSSWRSNFGSHCFQNVYAGANWSLTADSRHLFAISALPVDCLPPVTTLSPKFPSRESL